MLAFAFAFAGTSTWLTFITLTHNAGTSDLPKVSNIKLLDIWFFSCTCFIFASLLEFAIVNTIHRSKM
jgi:type III secretory pathway component EscU